MTRGTTAWALIAITSLVLLVCAHELLTVHAVDSGMAGSLLGRPSLDTLGHVRTALSLLALRLGLVLVAPGIVCATIAWLLVKKSR